MKTSAFILKSNLMLEREEMMVEKNDLSLMIKSKDKRLLLPGIVFLTSAEVA